MVMKLRKIAHTIKTGNYDAVATLSNKTSGFMRLFVGDDIEEMINEMDVPGHCCHRLINKLTTQVEKAFCKRKAFFYDPGSGQTE